MKLFTHYPNTQRQNQHAVMNWRENSINDFLFYSFRSTRYDRLTYPAALHYHDYYELVIYLEGDIHYICESDVFCPAHGDIILIPPGRLHMSMLDGESTHYVRHVFYLYPNALDPFGGSVLTHFLTQQTNGQLMTVTNPQKRQEMIMLLTKLDETLDDSAQEAEHALAIGLVLQLFYLFNQEHFECKPLHASLPETVIELQRFLDEHFADITSVQEVASHFYYSREYVSRLFRQHFNTTVADYLTKRRIAHSQKLITQGIALGEAGMRSGFASTNTFIRAFRSVTGMTPSAYRKALQE